MGAGGTRCARCTRGARSSCTATRSTRASRRRRRRASSTPRSAPPATPRRGCHVSVRLSNRAVAVDLKAVWSLGHTVHQTKLWSPDTNLFMPDEPSAEAFKLHSAPTTPAAGSPVDGGGSRGGRGGGGWQSGAAEGGGGGGGGWGEGGGGSGQVLTITPSLSFTLCRSTPSHCPLKVLAVKLTTSRTA